MSANRVSYTLESTLETVNSAEEAASRMAAEAGFGDEDVMKIGHGGARSRRQCRSARQCV